LLSAKTDKGEQIYIDKFGQQTTDPTMFDPTFNASAPHPLYYLNDQTAKVDSTPASLTGGIISTKLEGFDFGSTDDQKIRIGASEITTTASGTFADVVSNGVSATYSLTIGKGADTVTLDLFSGDSKGRNAAALDDLIDQKSGDLTDIGIGYTGSALNGDLTFYSTKIPPETFDVVFDTSGVTGGFSTSDFSTTGVGAQIGFPDAANVADPKRLGLRTSNVLKIAVDNSDPIEVSLPDSLRGKTLSGTELAVELTKAINNRFGDDKYIDLTEGVNNKFTLTATVDPTSPLASKDCDYGDGAGKKVSEALLAGITIEIPSTETIDGKQVGIKYSTNAANSETDLTLAIQKQVDKALGGPGIVKVGYDPKSR